MTDITTNRFPRLHRLTLAMAIIASGSAFAAEQPAESEQSTLPTVTLKAQSSAQAKQSYTAPKTATALPIGSSVREIPQSVSIITQQRIEDQGLSTLVDVAQNVTGINVQRYETNRGSIHARGFAIDNYQIDGIPTTYDQPWSAGEIFSSTALYERFDIVRGATGLMTGPGNPSAAINMIRKRATSKKTTANLEVSGGSWDTYRVMGDVAGALNAEGTVRLRGVVEYQQNESWADLLKNQKLTTLLTAEADITDSTLLSTGISYQQDEPQGPMWGGLPVWYSDGSRTNWSTSKTTSADWTRWDTDYTNIYADLTQSLGDNWKVKAGYSRGERNSYAKLLYLSGTPDRNTGLGLSAFPAIYAGETTQDDFYLNVNGKFELFGKQHEVALGALHSEKDWHSDNQSAISTPPTLGSFNTWNGASYPEPIWSASSLYEKNTTQNDAIYAVARLQVLDPVKVILGGRLSNYEKTGSGQYVEPYTMKFDNELIPYAGVIYDINDMFSAYASYTSIFQPQDKKDIDLNYLDPIKGNSAEVGLKGSFLDNRLNASLSLYKIQQDKYGVQAGTHPVNNVDEAYYRAADGTESKGFEFELSGAITPDWNVTAGYSQFSAKDETNQDIDTRLPRKTVNTFTTYKLPGQLSDLTVGAGVNWQSTTYTNATNPQGATERIEQDAFALVNLMARYQISPEVSAQLNINNVFDEKYFGMFDAYNQITWGAPRTTTLMLRYKF